MEFTDEQFAVVLEEVTEQTHLEYAFESPAVRTLMKAEVAELLRPLLQVLPPSTLSQELTEAHPLVERVAEELVLKRLRQVLIWRSLEPEELYERVPSLRAKVRGVAQEVCAAGKLALAALHPDPELSSLLSTLPTLDLDEEAAKFLSP